MLGLRPMISRVKWGAVCIAVMLLLIIILAATVKMQSSSKAVIAEQNRQLTQERDSAQAVASNAITLINLINDITRATRDEKNKTSADAKERVVYIRNKLASDSCANVVIDGDAVNSLREYADGLRKATIHSAQ